MYVATLVNGITVRANGLRLVLLLAGVVASMAAGLAVERVEGPFEA